MKIVTLKTENSLYHSAFKNMEAKIKITNRLWQARHRAGMEQKQMAYLLGHKTCDQVSRYERGDRLPNLSTALKLEIILQMPARELFPDLYEHHRRQIGGKNSVHQILPPEQETQSLQIGAHICTLETLVLQKMPTNEEIALALKHSVKLTRVLGEAISERNRRAEQ